jgi:type VI protein secretion system component Hcp
MAVDMFLKLSNDIKGESQDHKHKDEIDVLAWSWGVSQSGTFHQGGGGGSGKASFQDISVTKYVDKASNGLLRACSTSGGEKSRQETIGIHHHQNEERAGDLGANRRIRRRRPVDRKRIPEFCGS